MYKTYILCHISKEQIQRYVTLVNQVNHFEMKNVEYFSHTWKDDITKKIREQYCKSDTCMFKNDANIIGATKFFLDQNNMA